MAKVQGQHSLPKDLITCSLCLEIFDQPKTLPCLHTFCLKCLKQYVESKHFHGSLPCPICRRETQIPGVDVANFEDNFMIKNLIDHFSTQSQDDGIQVAKKEDRCECPLCDLPSDKCRFCVTCGTWRCGKFQVTNQDTCDLCKTHFQTDEQIKVFYKEGLDKCSPIIEERKNKIAQRLKDLDEENQQIIEVGREVEEQIRAAGKIWRDSIDVQEKTLIQKVRDIVTKQSENVNDLLNKGNDFQLRVSGVEELIDHMKNMTSVAKTHEAVKAINEFVQSSKPIYDDILTEKKQNKFEFHPANQLLSQIQIGYLFEGKLNLYALTAEIPNLRICFVLGMTLGFKVWLFNHYLKD